MSNNRKELNVVRRILAACVSRSDVAAIISRAWRAQVISANEARELESQYAVQVLTYPENPPADVRANLDYFVPVEGD